MLSISSCSSFSKTLINLPSYSSTQPHFLTHPLQFLKNPSFSLSILSKNPIFITKSSNPEQSGEVVTEQDEWLSKLPDKKKPLYAHSLQCIEAWLRRLGFYQSNEDRAVWFVEKPDWHAQLSLDITDIYIRYLKSGPGNLDKDVERRFSYALSREDIENAVLGGP